MSPQPGVDTHEVKVFRVVMRGPADVAGLVRLLEDGQLDARHIIAILGKTEGNGGVNDFTREYANSVFAHTLASYLHLPPSEIEARVALVMSGGTEGVLSPHATIFARVPAKAAASGAKRLAVGVASTRDFLPEELGRGEQIEETAHMVRVAMKNAGIRHAEDVHFVQIKCPLLTAERIEAAKARGRKTVTEDAYGSMAYSRGASALGVAIALDEIAKPVPVEAVLDDWSLYSSVASTSAGIELARNVIIVMGNAPGLAGEYVIGHSVMCDAIDLDGVLRAFSSVGLGTAGDLGALRSKRIVNVFAKAEPSPDGLVRGFRHTMLDDTDISPTRHARAAVGGLIAGLSGCGAVYVSGGAEHQGPSGGGPVAVIARVN
jgi:cyanuric acid amidohydrolase